MIERRPSDLPVAAPRPRRRTALAPAGVLVIYGVLAVIAFSGAWASPGTSAVGQRTDPIFSIWFLRWVPFAIGHGLNPLITDYLDFPSGANLTWSGLFALPALVLTPVTLIGGAVLAYNVMATLALALSAWTGFVAIRRYVPSTIGAFAGALLYGFSPAMMAQSLGHPQITMAFVPPLLLLALDEVVVRQRWSHVWSGLVLGGLAAIQLYTGEELLAAEVMVALAGIVLLAASYRDAIQAHLPYLLKAAAVAGAIFLLLAGPSMVVQFLGPQRVTGGLLQPGNTFVTDLVNFLLPTRTQALAPAAAVQLTARATGNLAEWDGYIGLPLLGLLIFSAIRYRHDVLLRLSGVLALLLSLLSLGVTLHVAGVVTPIPVALFAFGLYGLRGWFPVRPLAWTFLVCWAGLAVAPVLRNLLPARLMLFVFFFAGMLLAAFVREALSLSAGRGKALALALAGLSLVVLVPKLPYVSSSLSTPPFFKTTISAYVPAGSVTLLAPYSRGGHTDAMLWQADSGFIFKMPEGYALLPGPRASPPDSVLGSAMASVEIGQLGPLGPANLAEMRRDLEGWQVDTVIVGPMPHHDDMVRLFTALLGRPPRSVAGVDLWEGIQGQAALQQ